MCPGKELKAAARSSLIICARRTGRPHLGALCQLSAILTGRLLCLTCSCGLVVMLESGEEVAASCFSLMSSTITIDDATNALAKMNLRMLLLPSPRSLSPEKGHTLYTWDADQREVWRQIHRAMGMTRSSYFDLENKPSLNG